MKTVLFGSSFGTASPGRVRVAPRLKMKQIARYNRLVLAFNCRPNGAAWLASADSAVAFGEIGPRAVE
jgi:hypothetical protein